MQELMRDNLMNLDRIKLFVTFTYKFLFRRLVFHEDSKQTIFINKKQGFYGA